MLPAWCLRGACVVPACCVRDVCSCNRGGEGKGVTCYMAMTELHHIGVDCEEGGER